MIDHGASLPKPRYGRKTRNVTSHPATLFCAD
jgi:hypothetical protein